MDSDAQLRFVNMATKLRPLSQSMSHGGTGKIGKKVRASSTNSISCGLTLEGDRGQHNGMKGQQIGWPSEDSDRAASRGSECTSEEEDEFDNGEDEEKKDDCREHSRPATPTLLGHEVMEERARFTVYKILVKPRPEESWVVFRRYTDFARLNDKLKETFPGFRLALPPKRWFKDNFDPVFLEHRQAGLQAFLQNLVAHKDVTNCIPVRDFLCLDEPPGPFDSLVESRAFCEGLEETNYQLQRELLDRQQEIDTLRVSLDLSTNRLAVMEGQLRELGVEPRLQIPSDRRGSSSEGEYSTVEADQSPTMTASSWPPIHHSPGCTGAHAELAESPQEQRVDEVEHHLGLDDSSSYEQAEEALALNE